MAALLFCWQLCGDVNVITKNGTEWAVPLCTWLFMVITAHS